MSYKVSAKNRRLKRTLLSIIDILKFESLNIDTPKKIVLFSSILWCFSLFFNWIDSWNQNYIWNSFKSILWITWYLLFLINIKILFLIFSQNIKENIKSFFNFNVKDWIIIIFLWVFWLSLSINAIFIIENFSYFTQWIIIWKWVILSVVAYVFCIMWGILMLKTKTKTSIYIDWIVDNEAQKSNYELDKNNKKNMKLPF